jgi:hypothetical protein
MFSPLVFLLVITAAFTVKAQDTVTGAFEGTVTNSATGDPVENAGVEIINVETGISIPKTTDARGRFYQGLLRPGVYRIRISMPGFQPREVEQRLNIARTGEVVPVPVTLDPLTAVAAPPAPVTAADTQVRSDINTRDARRSGSFNEDQIALLPLGGFTLTRSFDELTLLLPGVAPPPPTLGSVAGPGQGAGVGTAGQFSINGLRSRGNNFTVDGSDNNDEDIGVRRQGFVALIPQAIESIREYQAITLLAPAQFGRNFGAQVNAVSKSGGSSAHGALYGFFNSSQLNSRNAFDTTNGSAVTALRTAADQAVLLDGQPLNVRNQSGGEDSFTLAKFGGTLGGAIRRNRTFYFFSGEGQIINARQEESFAVPTVEQRGAFRSGATGIFADPFTGDRASAAPASANGNLVYSLFPFPNNPGGVYGQNTLTHSLPARERGAVLSAKIDENFKIAGREQTMTGRYNFTNDRRDIPVTGQAIFSTLRPETRAQNFSFFFNSQISAAKSAREIFNQVRLSYGRTRLRFDEVRDREFLLPSTSFPGTPFLLNARVLSNLTRPNPEIPGPNAGPVQYFNFPLNTEQLGGPLGQIFIAGFSPVGVDVFNFPQRRVNNTYQLADALTLRFGDHKLALGTDNRRTELNSDLPRLFRPQAVFYGAPRLIFENGAFRAPASGAPNRFIRPEDLAAFGAASSFFLTFTNGRDDANINLRFYQTNFFIHDDWRVRQNLSLSLGLRYEYNTPPRENNELIERTFNDPTLDLAPGLRRFIDGRDRIFDPDRNNLAPRLSLAYSPKLLGKDRATVFRAGFGIFYDQILGSVVSQSRNVFPAFLTVNFAGLFAFPEVSQLNYLNPAFTALNQVRLAQPGTVNRLNPQLPLNAEFINSLNQLFPSAIGLTLPERTLKTPEAYQYTASFEQQLGSNFAVSAAYVGTQGRHLLRFITPNLGPGTNVAPASFGTFGGLIPNVSGRICSPSPSSRGICHPGRVVGGGIGSVTLFATSANSRYDSLQLEARGRLRKSLQFQASYTLSSAEDDVSDVFDLAGAYALPQNSLSFAGERGPANFDLRHLMTYHFVYDLTMLGERAKRLDWFLDGLQLAGIGRFHSGRPFTVNSIFDVNLDGNLTDRLNSTDGLVATGDPRQPLRLSTTNLSALIAAAGQDGVVGRNSFRAGGLAEVNLAIIKAFRLGTQPRLNLRADFFNLFNRANFGIPVRLLEAPGFGRATNTSTPGRRVQIALKLVF